MSRLYLSSKHSPRVLEDGDVLDRVGVGVRVLKISLGSFTESFITSAGDGVKVLNISQGSFTESFIKIQHLEVFQESTYPPSHFLESWRERMFLMELEMVSRNSRYPREVLLKVSSRSNIRKLVKTPPIFQVSSWSFGGKGCS